jgi:hypothetical protein
MRWFGESWGAPCNEPQDRAPTPVGSVCVGCKQVVNDDDQGLVIPSLRPSGSTRETAWHLDCLLRRIGAPPRPALSGLRAAIQRVRRSFGSMSAVVVCRFCGTTFPRREAESDDAGRPLCIACGKPPADEVGRR